MDQTTFRLSANTLHCALELSKDSWLLAIQFRDREQPSLYLNRRWEHRKADGEAHCSPGLLGSR